jgi:quercetin dioxygenase-like cupin family protein
MAGVDVRSFEAPDETRPFTDKGQADVVTIGGGTVLRGIFEPGWRWSDHVKPIAGTESCQSPHFLYMRSGRMKVVMDDGTEGEAGPGDVVRIERDTTPGLSVRKPARWSTSGLLPPTRSRSSRERPESSLR